MNFSALFPTSLISAHTRVLHYHPSSIISVVGTVVYSPVIFNHRIRLILYQVVFGAYLLIGTWVGSAVKRVTEGGSLQSRGRGVWLRFVFLVSLSPPKDSFPLSAIYSLVYKFCLGAFFFFVFPLLIFFSLYCI
jgi:hypothetical protein